VAKKNVEVGACIINDISAGSMDTEMMKTVAELQVPYIMMHMRGTPQNMQVKTDYENLVKEILFYFSEKIAEASNHKINDIIIDPGFGFGKKLEHNYDILNKLDLFKTLELPILIGVSRKSMIHKLLEIRPEEALNGTTCLNTIALIKGAKILRVHDVKEAMQCVKIINQLVS
jgi:dihydropteroate synthase